MHGEYAQPASLEQAELHQSHQGGASGLLRPLFTPISYARTTLKMNAPNTMQMSPPIRNCLSLSVNSDKIVCRHLAGATLGSKPSKTNNSANAVKSSCKAI